MSTYLTRFTLGVEEWGHTDEKWRAGTRLSQWEELYVCYITMCFYPPCFWHLDSGFEVRPFSRWLTEHVCVLHYRCADKHNLKHKVQGLYCQIQNLETGGDWHLSVYPQGFKELQLPSREWEQPSLSHLLFYSRWGRMTAMATEPNSNSTRAFSQWLPSLL